MAAMERPGSNRPEEQPGRPGEDRPTDRLTAAQLERRRRGTIAKVVLAVVILVLFLIFIIQNSDSVEVSFVLTTAEIPLVWVFLGCALIGAAVAYLVGRPGRRATKKLIAELERQRAGKRPER